MDPKTPSTQPILMPKRTTSMAEAVLLLVIVILFSWFIVLPKLSAYSASNKALSAVEGQLAQAEKDKEEITRLVTKLKSSSNAIELTDESVPLNGRVTKLQVLIEQLANFAGIQLSSMEVAGTGQVISAGNKQVLTDPYKSDRQLRTDEVTVILSGTVDQFRNFLELMENNTRILDVSDFAITSDQQSTRFTLTLKAYAYEVK